MGSNKIVYNKINVNKVSAYAILAMQDVSKYSKTNTSNVFSKVSESTKSYFYQRLAI